MKIQTKLRDRISFAGIFIISALLSQIVFDLISSLFEGELKFTSLHSQPYCALIAGIVSWFYYRIFIAKISRMNILNSGIICVYIALITFLLSAITFGIFTPEKYKSIIGWGLETMLLYIIIGMLTIGPLVVTFGFGAGILAKKYLVRR